MSKVTQFLSRHKKSIILLAVLLAAAAAFQVRQSQAAAAAQAAQAQVQTFSLHRGDLARTLSVSGAVQSGSVTQVATAQTMPVDEILVQEGDTVKAGDVLVKLDTSRLDTQIAAQQQAVAAEKKQSDLAVAQAQRKVEDARNQKTIDEGVTASMDQADRDARLRQDNLAIEDAQDALVNALAAAEAPSAAAQQLKSLQSDKKQCTITAPCDGIVTQIQAVEGGAATNIAVIEDQNALEAVLNVREYDVNQLAVGQTVTLVSGAQDTFHGTVSWIAPKAQTNGDNGASYSVKVTVTDPTPALRLGMSVRAKVLLEEKKNVFNVPLDAVGTDENGQSVIYRKDTDEAGGVTFTPVPVTTGMETDLSVEVSGEGLSEGMELRSLADLEEVE